MRDTVVLQHWVVVPPKDSVLTNRWVTEPSSPCPH